MNDTAAPTLPSLPLVAILRGLEPQCAAEVAGVLFDAGFRALEVPLNRPGALECLQAIARCAPPQTLVGAGTVMDVAQVDDVHAAGGRLIVMPHTDVEVIRHARQQGLFVAPGVFTASEAFTALKAGAHALKLFPAEVLGPAGLAALRTVLPAGTALWPVGGITPPAMAAWRHAGATGFGLGSALFQPGMELQSLRSRAVAFVEAWHASSP
jgi:2-dehydro-3-deoxyphosphogalactonate aldolase